jgi:uncharacterized membrane protein
MPANESNLRSILKAVSWRGSGFVATVLLVIFFTRNTKAAFEIGGVEALFKIFLYFLHERIWNRVEIGKENGSNSGGAP